MILEPGAQKCRNFCVLNVLYYDVHLLENILIVGTRTL
jgi:hypothetical protein